MFQDVEQFFVVLRSLRDEGHSLAEFQPRVHAGGVFFGDLIDEAGIAVFPGGDDKVMAAEALERDFRGPAVVVDEGERIGAEFGFIRGAQQDFAAEFVMAVGEEIGLDGDEIADEAADREFAVIDARGDGFDGKTRSVAIGLRGGEQDRAGGGGVEKADLAGGQSEGAAGGDGGCGLGGDGQDGGKLGGAQSGQGGGGRLAGGALKAGVGGDDQPAAREQCNRAAGRSGVRPRGWCVRRDGRGAAC